MAVCVGCGLEVDPATGVLSVDLASGGGLSCGGDGLFVNFPAAGAANSAVIGANGCGAMHQLLDNGGGGIRALHTKSRSGNAVGAFNQPFPQPITGPFNTYGWEANAFVDVTLDGCANTLIGGMTRYAIGGVQVVTVGAAFVSSQLDITQEYGSGVVWAATTPPNTASYDSRLIGGVEEKVYSVNHDFMTWQTLGPGANLHLSVRLIVVCHLGSGRVEGMGTGPSWSITYHYSHL